MALGKVIKISFSKVGVFIGEMGITPWVLLTSVRPYDVPESKNMCEHNVNFNFESKLGT